MSLSKEQLIKAIDTKSGRFRIDRVKITTPDRIYRGSGILECRDRVELSITLSKGISAPELPKGIVSRKDFWKLKGVIEDSLQITIDSLMPSSRTHSGRGYDTIIFRVDELEIRPDEFDRMTSTQIAKMLSKHRDATKSSNSESPKKERDKIKAWEATFFCVLKNYKLFALNKGTDVTEANDFLGEKRSSRSDTFMGVLPGWKYGLIQVGDDVHVHFRSEEGYKSKGKVEDRKHFDAFLKAVAFTHGQHTWHSQLEYRRHHKLLINKLKITKKTSKTPHTPFSDAMWFNGHIGKIDWTLTKPLEIAYKFFLDKTELSEEVGDLLYLFREAGGDGVPIKVELLTLCSLYESLMRSVFTYKSREKGKSADVVAFVKARDLIVAELKKRKGEKEGLEAAAFSRLTSILASASGESIREIVNMVTSHLITNDSVNWKEIHKEWTAFRNPLSHTISGRTGSKDDLSPEVLAVSRIAGAINIIILKLMGYSGLARISTFEDKYKNI